MRKILNAMVFVFLLVLFIAVHSEQASADSSVTTLPNFHYANQDKTPSANTFIIRFGKDTVVDSITGAYKNGYLDTNWSTQVSSAMVRHVGFYHGKDVDVKITIQKSQNNLDGGSLKVGDPDYFLGIDIRGEMRVSYEFFGQDGQPLEVETAFNYQGLNSNKTIGFLNPDHTIKSIYANNPTNIVYYTGQDSNQNSWMYFTNHVQNIPYRHPTQSLEVATAPISRIDAVIHNNDSTTSSLVYYTDFLAPPEFSRAEAVSNTASRADQVELLATQTMPSMTKNSRMQQLQLDFGANLAEGKQYEIDHFSVTNFNGEDLTEKFVSTPLSKEEWLIEVKDPTDDHLYDTTLKYKLSLKWVGSAQQPVDEQLLQNNQLPLAFHVQTMINGEMNPMSEAVETINYLGEVTINLEDQNGETLQTPIIKKGYVTSAFDVTEEYPEIPGYYPVKNAPEDDRGIFLPESQNITHRYAKGEPIRFVLTKAEEPLKIPRFSHTRKLSFTINHAAKDSVSVLAKCGEAIQKLKTYPAGQSEINDTIDFKVPPDWLNKEVQFYVENNLTQRSNIEIRHLQVETGPELFLPASLSFGEQEIPAQNQTIPAANQEAVKIEDDSQLEESHWTIKVKEQVPLTSSQSNKLEKALSFQTSDQTFWLNDKDQVIWQGEGTQKLTEAGQFNLSLKPSDKIGSYQGVVLWTMEDAPQ